MKIALNNRITKLVSIEKLNKVLGNDQLNICSNIFSIKNISYSFPPPAQYKRSTIIFSQINCTNKILKI